MSKKEKYKRGARVVSYGLAGDIAGTVAGVYTGFNPKIAGRMGAGAGLAYGGWRESKRVPSVEESTGKKEFKRRVGTKTQGRVSKKDNPFDMGKTGVKHDKLSKVSADISAV